MNLTVDMHDEVVVNSQIKIKDFNLNVTYESIGKEKYLSKETNEEILKAVSRKLETLTLEKKPNIKVFTTKENLGGKVESFVWGLVENKLEGFESGNLVDMIDDYINRIDMLGSSVDFFWALEEAYRSNDWHLQTIAYLVWKKHYKDASKDKDATQAYIRMNSEIKEIKNTLKNDFKIWRYYSEIKEFYPGASIATLLKIFIKVSK